MKLRVIFRRLLSGIEPRRRYDRIAEYLCLFVPGGQRLAGTERPVLLCWLTPTRPGPALSGCSDVPVVDDRQITPRVRQATRGKHL
jgi:hypothetical protein